MRTAIESRLSDGGLATRIVEYALIIALIAVVVIASALFFA